TAVCPLSLHDALPIWYLASFFASRITPSTACSIALPGRWPIPPDERAEPDLQPEGPGSKRRAPGRFGHVAGRRLHLGSRQQHAELAVDADPRARDHGEAEPDVAVGRAPADQLRGAAQPLAGVAFDSGQRPAEPESELRMKPLGAAGQPQLRLDEGHADEHPHATIHRGDAVA